MGSKPSRVRGVVAVLGGVQQVCLAPKQEVTASAPPTPQHPEGEPRPCSPAVEASSPDAAAGSPLLPQQQRGAAVRQTHPGGRAWPEGQAADAGTLPPAQGGVAVAGPPGEEELRFDAPLEEVLAQATEAFGSVAAALASPKWDRRVQALKGVGAVLKGLDLRAAGPGGAAQARGQVRAGRGLQLRDAARCFTAACLILNIVLRDKVLPVLFAAHELYRLTFEHGQSSVPEEVAAYAMATLLQHILAKLGETNIRLHESACAAFVFSTGSPPRLGLSAAFARLQLHLDGGPARGPQRTRAHAGALDAVGQLLRRFPGRRAGEGDESDAAVAWSAADVAPFVAAGMQVDAATAARVQQAAASLAVTVYTTLGKGALDEVLAGLPVAAKELVLQKVLDETGDFPEDGDGEDPDDEAGGGEELPPGAMDGLELCVMGVALRPPEHQRRGGRAEGAGLEECFMDEILEETGLVFQGQGLKFAGQGKEGFGMNALDEDLRALGLLDAGGGGGGGL